MNAQNQVQIKEQKLEIEKQNLEIEKQNLEIKEQKLEIEKQKLEDQILNEQDKRKVEILQEGNIFYFLTSYLIFNIITSIFFFCFRFKKRQE